jgi:hypothetical protein
MFLKDGTADQVILWSPVATANVGNYITHNPTANQSTIGLGTGTPIIFTLEPVNDFTSFNTVTQVGNWVGPATTGTGSRVGSCVDITSDGQTVVISDGAEGLGGQTIGTVKIYRYVSTNNWTLVTNIIGTDIGLTNTLIAGTPMGFGVDLKINSNGNRLAIASNGGNTIGMIALYSLINGVWRFVGLNYGRGVSGTFGDKLTMSNGGRVIVQDPYFSTSIGLAYIFEMASIDVASKIVSADVLKLNSGNLDLMPGADSATGASYTIKNTGTFLNNGGLVIYNSATPTLTLMGGSATGHSLEFRNSAFTNDWGNSNVWDWRFALDTYNGTQSMAFQGRINSTTYNFAFLNATECAFTQQIGSPSTSIPLVLSPTNLGVSNAGSYSIISAGSQREVDHDISILGIPRMRLIGGRINTGSYFYGAITNETDFEIQTGRAANTALTSGNYLSNRRLHISSAGDVAFGTTAISGTKLTVAGDVTLIGTVKATGFGHTYIHGPLSLANTVVKSGTDSEMGVAYSGRVVLSSDGTVMVTSSVLSKSIYIYRKVNGTFESSPSSTITRAETDFGSLFSLSRNGLKIAASTPNGTTIWIYIWNSGTSSWDLQTQTITSTNIRNLKLTSDGSKVAILRHRVYPDSSAIVYNTITGTSLVSMDTCISAGFANPSLSTGFSDTDVSIEWVKYRFDFSSDGSTLVAGSYTQGSTGCIVVFDINYTNNSSSVRSFYGAFLTGGYVDSFGRKMALNADGTVMAIAAGPINSTGGQVITFKRALGSGTSGWELTRRIAASEVPASPSFGADICLNDSGTVLYMSSIKEIGVSLTTAPTVAGIVARSIFSGGSWGTPTVVASGLSTAYYGYGIATNSIGGQLAVSEFKGTAESPHGGKVYIYEGNPNPLNITSNGDIIFNTSGKTNASMIIAATGEVGIGISPVTGTKLTVSGDATVTGTVTNSSDDRLKENEVLITNATDILLKLRPEIYDKKPEFYSTDPSTFYKESGLIAQDIWYGAPELRHLVKLGSRAEFVCEYQPINYPPLVAGVDISGVEYVTVEIPNNIIVDASGNPIDISGNPVDISGNPIDMSGNSLDVSGNLVDASGNLVDASGNPVDASGNVIDASGNVIDASGNVSGNTAPQTQTQIITIDNRPQSVCVTKTIYKPINPADIVEIPLTADVQQDPDYTALGWGDTPASVNYIGLLPYLVKSIQELNSEIDALGTL